MKKFLLALSLVIPFTTFGQSFEEPKDNSTTFEKPTVKVGGDFALQYQMLSHQDDANNLIKLGKGFNLPTANLNLDANLAQGIKLNLVTYLSARHHNEAWVKGGYLLIDQLPFLHSSFVDNAMQYLTIKAGVMELNYGDAHFRRSDNGNVIHNPFVGNYIMDAFTTSPGVEVMFRKNGIIAMAAVASGSLNPTLSAYKASDSTYTSYNTLDELAVYGKIGYDNAITSDLRVRVTASGYYCGNNHSGSLYNADRTGSRYYLVMNRMTYSATDVDIKSNHLSGNWGPGASDKDASAMLNAFIKYKGLEFFGTYENVNNTNPAGSELKFNQFAVEGLYRFGTNEQFFLGARYNKVNGNTKKLVKNVWTETDQSVDRIETGIGWFMLPSTVIKLDYVKQNYNDFAEYGGKGQFSGMMFEAAISF